MQVINDAFKAIGAKHRWCVRHPYANLKLEYKGKALKDALWNCVITTTKSTFDKELERMEKDAIKWVKKGTLCIGLGMRSPLKQKVTCYSTI